MKLDLAQVKSLFSNADYARGMEYFRQGRVLDMIAGDGENPVVRCCVRGSEVYSVRFQQLEYGYMRIGCSCPRFEDMGRCKHNLRHRKRRHPEYVQRRPPVPPHRNRLKRFPER